MILVILSRGRADEIIHVELGDASALNALFINFI